MPSPDIQSLETTLGLMQALHLAQRGRLREAEGVIAPTGLPPQSLLELRALAALVTGQGDYRRALPLWQAIRQREPGDAEAQRLIEAIELWQARPAWMKFVLPAAGLLAGAALLGILLAVV